MRAPLTRRSFIHAVGRAGGGAAAYATMAAMGVLPVPAFAGMPALAPNSGRGVRVVVLGAGMAGMAAAHELRKAGYAVTVLEARARPGGRSWTLRGGDAVVETDSRQAVRWPRGRHLYFNPGPARIPHHHRAILAYCREFGVEVAPIVNENRAALVQDDRTFGGRPQPLRRVIADSRGLVAEMAAKAVDRAALDGPLAGEDLERLRAFLRGFGALDRELAWRGSARAGYAEWPSAGPRAGRALPPLDPRELMRSDFWAHATFAEGVQQAATMLEPVGGMDAIARAFARALGDSLNLGAEVTRLRRERDGARVEWRVASGARRAVFADFVVVTAPAPVAAMLDADFAPERRAALARLGYVKAAKIAFRAKRRFWELDDAIYGGISWTGRDVTQLWYPSAGFNRREGILVGGYIWTDAIGERFAALAPAARAALAIADGERLHPGYGGAVTAPVSVAWAKVPHALGAWAEYDAAQRRDDYPLLCRPEGPYHFAGEHLSWVPGWQEGAVLSAHDTVAAIAEAVRAKRG